MPLRSKRGPPRPTAAQRAEEKAAAKARRRASNRRRGFKALNRIRKAQGKPPVKPQPGSGTTAFGLGPIGVGPMETGTAARSAAAARVDRQNEGMSRRGRRTTLTVELAEGLRDLLAQGLPVGETAARAGVHRSTLANWLRGGRLDAVLVAHGRQPLGGVQDGAEGDPQGPTG